MKKIILILFMSASIFANSVVDLYRQDGMEAVQSYIENKLVSKEYWRETLKNKDVSFGYYEQLGNLLIANKDRKTLKMYKNVNNILNLSNSYDNVIVGADGDKQKEGDLITPIGVYNLSKKFKPADDFYGPFAFALSYPNTFDKLKDKDGHGIWIHGSPLDGSPRALKSKGCIVLDNNRIISLDANMQSKKSIIIVSQGDLKIISKEQISTLLAGLFKWKESWAKSDIKGYLSFYSKKFKRFDRMNKKQFTSMKKSIFSRKQKKSIVFKNINIIPYPNQDNKNLFKISFYEIYKARNYHYKGNKELYVEATKNGFAILAEK